jgi:RHS repeat-associated protein
MRYDVDGRRVQLSASGVITNYLWDTTTRYGDVLLETGTNGAFKTSYVYGNACGSCSVSPTAELVGQKRGTFNSFVTEYHLLDGQGSVRGLTGDTGTLTQEYAYDTFGKLTSGDASKSAYLYTGQQYDAATELYSLRARYYSPQQGRFLTMDKWPVNYQNPKELNRYGYTANNPINYYDPTGNEEQFVTWKFIGQIIWGYASNALKGAGIFAAAAMVSLTALLFISTAFVQNSTWADLTDDSRAHRVCTNEQFPIYCTYLLSKSQTGYLANRGGMGGAVIAVIFSFLKWGTPGLVLSALLVPLGWELDGMLNDLKDANGRLGFIVYGIPPMIVPFKVIPPEKPKEP